MSKNADRYKDHLENLDDDDLLELETKSFEKFAPKKSQPKKKKKEKSYDQYED